MLDTRIKLLSIISTKTEAIRLVPFVKELESCDFIEHSICLVGNSRESFQQLIDDFKLRIDYDLNDLADDESNLDIITDVFFLLEPILKEITPNIVLVYGTNTYTMASTFTAFYQQIPIGFIDASMEANNLIQYAEDASNKDIICRCSTFHFTYKDSLEKNVSDHHIVIPTPNQLEDVAQFMFNQKLKDTEHDWIQNEQFIALILERNNMEMEELKHILNGIEDLTNQTNFKIVLPISSGISILEYIQILMEKNDNVLLTEPLDPITLHHCIKNAQFVITDDFYTKEACKYIHKKCFYLKTFTSNIDEENESIEIISYDVEEIKNRLQHFKQNLPQEEVVSQRRITSYKKIIEYLLKYYETE